MLRIMTLNWNGIEKLKELIPSTLQALKNQSFSWTIRDNGSTDGSVEFIEQNYPQISVIRVSHNRDNFSKGMNSIFKELNCDDEDFILLLNNDIVFKDSESIDKMINLFNSKKDVGVVGAKLLYKNTNKIQHCGVVFNNNKAPLHLDDNVCEKPNHSLNKEFQVVTGAVWLTKAGLYKKISSFNGLDEDFHWAFDDVAACLSLKYNHNKKILYCGSTKIEHESSASLKINPVNRLYLNQNFSNLLKKFKDKIKSDFNDYSLNPNHLKV